MTSTCDTWDVLRRIYGFMCDAQKTPGVEVRLTLDSAERPFAKAVAGHAGFELREDKEGTLWVRFLK